MENELNTSHRSNVWVWVVVTIIVLVIAGYVVWVISPDKSNQTKQISSPSVVTRSSSWQDLGVAVAGQFADADVVDLGNGQYRMYYGVEPEVADNNLEIYSSTSSDGITWTKEDGTRKTMATFPDVVRLPDNSWRMYFQNAGVIKSAASTDGLVWTDEPGVRIDTSETGYAISQVAAPTTIKTDDGTYMMVYSGTIKQPYQTTEKLPNNDTRIFFHATSTDGLTFSKKGIALDTQNTTLLGFADGPDLVNWNNQIRLYFWGYSGIYHLSYSSDKFSTDPTVDFTNSTDANVKFAPNPPSDPTLIKIGNTWYMYYGQHTKGIYYATLN